MDATTQKEITNLLHKIISKWTNRYIYQIFFISYEDPYYQYSAILDNGSYSYYCEISRPEILQPIPQAKCKIYFDVVKGGEASGFVVSFRFESESLNHRWDEMTLRPDSFEVTHLTFEFIELAGKSHRHEVTGQVRAVSG